MGAARRFWHDNALAIILAVLWIAILAGHGWISWIEEMATASDHGAAATLSGWWKVWVFELFNGWQGDVAQTLLIVVLSRYFLFRGSAESRDGEDRIEERLARIERKLG